MEREREEKRLKVKHEMEHELEVRWIEAEKKKTAMELKRARLEFESKKVRGKIGPMLLKKYEEA